uniref:Uncharacterized protein n=1 Tax=Parastrongyloides trichosuri TaxID=131310 RepID=A0A0N5A542_PARTI
MDKIALKENAQKLVKREFLLPLEERPIPLKPDFYLKPLGRTSPINFDLEAIPKDGNTLKNNEQIIKTTDISSDIRNKPLTSVDFDEEEFLKAEEEKRKRRISNTSIKGILKK